MYVALWAHDQVFGYLRCSSMKELVSVRGRRDLAVFRDAFHYAGQTGQRPADLTEENEMFKLGQLSGMTLIIHVLFRS